MTDDLLANALEHSPEGAAIYELDGTVLMMNPIAEQIMGASFDKLRGKRLFEHCPELIDSAFQRAFRNVARGSDAQDFQHYRKKDDHYYAGHIVRVDDRVHVYGRDVSEDVRRQRRLDTLAKVSEVLARTELDLTASGQAVADILRNVIGADCNIAMLAPDGEWLVTLARSLRDPTLEEMFNPVPRWHRTLGHTDVVLRTRRPVLERDTRVTEEDAPEVYAALEAYQMSSVIMAPLLVGDVPVGVVIALRRAGEDLLSRHDVELIEEVSPSLALYLANAARRAETEFLRSRLTAMADALPVLACFVDAEERYQYVNAAYERWFGVARDRVIGLHVRELLGAAAYADVAPHIREVLAGKPVRFRAHIDYPTGPRDVDAQLVPIATPAGGVEGFAGLIADVSNEMRIVEGERQTTARLQSMLALTARLAAARTTDEVARVLVDGGRGTLDAAAATMWQLVSADVAVLVRGSGTSSALGCPLEAQQRKPLSELGPVAECLTTGRPVWVSASAEPTATTSYALLPLLAGTTKSCLGFSFAAERHLSSDERAYLEILASHGAEALRRTQALDELTQSVQNAETARADAERANRSKDEFLAMLGHELRNPLAPLVTALELMDMRGDSTFARERAVLGRQVQHLSRLVDDLLDVSRISRGAIELRRERVRLAEIIAKAVEQTSPLFDERRHHLTIEVPPELVLDGDPTRLGQVFSNLLSNSAKYTPSGGQVTVTAAQCGDDIRVSIRDNGIGIPTALLPHVFDLFVQAQQSSERPAGGLGLGLTIVRSLVERHGGHVTVTSEGPGHGSEFVVTLPSPVIAVAADHAEAQRTRRPSAKRVLVVDDNEDAAMMLADVLDAYGHEIRTAFDGPSALRIADEFHPDVAVLDIGLPVMDGYELGERLRAGPATHDVRLIAVTGYGQESARRRSMEAGFAAHLAKPVEIDALVRLVENR